MYLYTYQSLESIVCLFFKSQCLLSLWLCFSHSCDSCRRSLRFFLCKIILRQFLHKLLAWVMFTFSCVLGWC